jgi:hypothetical protein
MNQEYEPSEIFVLHAFPFSDPKNKGANSHSKWVVDHLSARLHVPKVTLFSRHLNNSKYFTSHSQNRTRSSTKAANLLLHVSDVVVSGGKNEGNIRPITL